MRRRRREDGESRYRFSRSAPRLQRSAAVPMASNPLVNRNTRRTDSSALPALPKGDRCNPWCRPPDSRPRLCPYKGRKSIPFAVHTPCRGGVVMRRRSALRAFNSQTWRARDRCARIALFRCGFNFIFEALSIGRVFFSRVGAFAWHAMRVERDGKHDPRVACEGRLPA